MNLQLDNCAFVAEALVAHLRNGYIPDSNAAKCLDRQPMIDILRRQVTLDDMPWVVTLINSHDECCAGLGCSLTRYVVNEPCVCDCLQNRWNSAGPYLRNRLMWRLLEVSALATSWRATFVEFIDKQWDTFCAFNRTFYGAPKLALTLSNRESRIRKSPKKRSGFMSPVFLASVTVRKQRLRLHA